MPPNQTGMGHHATANLQAIVDSGRGDRPLKDLKFRCAQCGSWRTDAVMMGQGGIGVQPWRPTSHKSILDRRFAGRSRSLTWAWNETASKIFLA